MERVYKISPRNSTICGYPGRDFDWSKFCWDGKVSFVDRCHVRGCSHCHTNTAPLPWVDGKAKEYGEYLHVPYDYECACTIYRVRPNESMYAGEVYRGKLIKQQRAIKKDDGWYWQLEFESILSGEKGE